MNWLKDVCTTVPVVLLTGAVIGVAICVNPACWSLL